MIIGFALEIEVDMARYILEQGVTTLERTDAEIELTDPKKQNVVCELGMGEDIISQLPDSILHHILSFRSTKRAVSTSILSKRWKYLWMSTTNLYFKCPYYDKNREKLENKFTQFVDRVLSYHSSNITSFNLTSSVESGLDAIRVESWISAAVERRVQVIHVSACLEELLLPCCICTSKVLRVLELSSCGNLQLPSTVWLPSLTILRLVGVKFIDDLSFNRLLSGLPNIEELELNNFGWDDIKNVGISLPTLRRLRLVVRGYFRSDQVVIKVNARNLRDLDYHSNLKVNLIIDNMPPLDEAKIQFPHRCAVSDGGAAAAAQHAANLFGDLCFAKSIKIARVIEYLLDNSKLENTNLVPKFVNLTSLEVDSRVTSSTTLLVMTIFQNAPLLESLVIKEVCGGKWSRKSYPHCIEFSLKSCSVLRFSGRYGEILFVKFLIKAAKVLEKLKIKCSVDLQYRQEKLENVKHMLETLPRASKSCVIEFL